MSTQHAYGTAARVNIEAHWCGNCNVPYGLPEGFLEARRKDHKTWYCPNGCSRWYPPGESDAEKLRKAQIRETALQDQLSAAIRDGEATRAALMRDRQRFANGVCPCCNRSFPNVRAHMATKHPDFSADVRTVVKAYKCSCGRKFETYAGLRIHQGRQREAEGTFAWDKPGQSRWYAHLTEVGAR